MPNFAFGEESFAITSIGKAYMTKERHTRYIAGEDMDFVWCEREVREFDHMWRGGLSVWDIARAFDRDPDEVLILVIDRVRGGHIEPRKHGVYGRRRRM